MLQQNHLYRRISNRNLFRTLSRAYSRQTPQRLPHTQNKQTLRNIPTSIPDMQTNTSQQHNYARFNTLEHSAKRLQLTTQTEAIFRRKMSGCTALNVNHQFRKQNFNLRSCNQSKEVTYEGEQDQTDFSILEYNKRSQFKKQSEEKQQREIEHLGRIGLIRGRFKKPSNAGIIKTQMDKRLAAHLLSRSNKTIQGCSFISRPQFANQSTNV